MELEGGKYLKQLMKYIFNMNKCLQFKLQNITYYKNINLPNLYDIFFENQCYLIIIKTNLIIRIMMLNFI
jgi:hypothetical protein